MKTLLLPLLLLAGCRFAAYTSPDGTRVIAGSVFTDPRGSFVRRVTPTTQEVRVEYESKSNVDKAIELLQTIK